MSLVTGLTIVTSCVEDEVETIINQWLQEHNPGWLVKNVADQGGGSKHSQMHVFVGGLNYFTPEDRIVFFEFIKTIVWDSARSVVVIINHEGDDEPAHVWRP